MLSYFADDAEQDEEVLVQAAQQLAQLSFAGTLTLELGRSIAAGCGTYLTRVVDVKENRGKSMPLWTAACTSWCTMASPWP